jgi:hypothetical protein
MTFIRLTLLLAASALAAFAHVSTAAALAPAPEQTAPADGATFGQGLGVTFAAHDATLESLGPLYFEMSSDSATNPDGTLANVDVEERSSFGGSSPWDAAFESLGVTSVVRTVYWVVFRVDCTEGACANVSSPVRSLTVVPLTSPQALSPPSGTAVAQETPVTLSAQDGGPLTFQVSSSAATNSDGTLVNAELGEGPAVGAASGTQSYNRFFWGAGTVYWDAYRSQCCFAGGSARIGTGVQTLVVTSPPQHPIWVGPVQPSGSEKHRQEEAERSAARARAALAVAAARAAAHQLPVKLLAVHPVSHPGPSARSPGHTNLDVSTSPYAFLVVKLSRHGRTVKHLEWGSHSNAVAMVIRWSCSSPGGLYRYEVTAKSGVGRTLRRRGSFAPVSIDRCHQLERKQAEARAHREAEKRATPPGESPSNEPWHDTRKAGLFITQGQAEAAAYQAGYLLGDVCTSLPGERMFFQAPVRYHEWMCPAIGSGRVYVVAVSAGHTRTFFQEASPTFCEYSSGAKICVGSLSYGVRPRTVQFGP